MVLLDKEEVLALQKVAKDALSAAEKCKEKYHIGTSVQLPQVVVQYPKTLSPVMGGTILVDDAKQVAYEGLFIQASANALLKTLADYELEQREAEKKSLAQSARSSMFGAMGTIIAGVQKIDAKTLVEVIEPLVKK
jgi:hypothetical protein